MDQSDLSSKYKCNLTVLVYHTNYINYGSRENYRK